MSRHLIALEARLVAELVKNGRAVLVDIREPADFRERRPKGAVNRPLSSLEPGTLDFPGQELVFTSAAGELAAGAGERLASALRSEAFVMRGGVQAWAAAGLPLEEG